MTLPLPMDHASARRRPGAGALDAAGPEERTHFERLARVAARQLGAPFAVIALGDGAELLVLGAAGLPEPWSSLRRIPADLLPLPPVERITGPLLIADVGSAPAAGAPPRALGPDVRAFAAAPLAAGGGEPLGVVLVGAPEPREWTAADAEALIDVAALCIPQLELRELRQFHHHLGSASPVIAFRDGSRDFCTDYVTPNLTQVLGYEPVEVVGVPHWWPERLHPDDRELALRRQAEAIAARRPALEHEFRMRHRDGGFRWLRSFARYEYADDGALRELWGFMLDVTERREAEVARDRTAEELRRVVAHSPDLVARFDSRLRHLFVNPQVEATVGLSALEIVGRTNRELGFPDALVQRWDEAIREVFRTGQSTEVEFCLQQDGGERWFQSHLVPEWGAGGEVVSVLGVSRDVTRYREALDQLRYHLDLTSTVTTHVAEGLCFMDASGRVTFMNPAAERILGWTWEEIGDRLLHDCVHFLHPDGTPFPAAECPLLDVLRGGPPVRDREDVWIRKDGEFIPVYCSSTPILRDGKIVGAVLSVHDISGRKRAEHERELLLAGEREAREEAERANRVKAEFLAVMSHELRTPLTAVLGFSELLRLGIPTPISDEACAQVEKIESAAQHLLEMIEEILAFSRIEAGQERVRHQQVDLCALASETVEIMRPLADRKGLLLSIDLPTALDAETDAGKVRQVLVNLLSNAVKFTPEGEVRLTLRDGAGASVFEVHDTGPGIASEHLDRIFEPFHQLDQGNTRSVGGTGLGLAVSRRIAEMLGGELTVESGVSTGSVFRFRLPSSGVAATG